jgi:Fur family ferric uptake transcriptional regulator
METGEHLSASAITSQVHDVDPAINESSVYRTLGLFTDLGLVRESRLDDTTMWEPFHEDAAIHLICSGCGKVIHHDTELVNRLRAALDRDVDFVPEEIDVRVSGRCKDCATDP